MQTDRFYQLTGPALLALLCVVTVAPANLLANGDFSSWDSPTQPTGWVVEFESRVRVEQATSPTHSDPYSVLMTRLFSGTGDNNGVRQFIPVQRNQAYTLTAWWHDDNVDVRGGAGITWCRADSTALPGGSPPVVYTDSAIHDWQRLQLTATAPDSPSLALVKVYLRCYGFTGNQPNGFAHLDDAEFVEGAGAVTEQAPAPARLQFRVTPVTRSGFRCQLELPAERRVSIDLYDLTGTCRTNLFAGALPAGRHSVAAGGEVLAALPDGVYFAVLTGAADAPVTRKLALAR
jgi:hypothetical protein